ncbi:DUF3888 domain-containing protein [Lysinibacillus cavernae]|uniref:DUF3888 domain-containing protein n=1 Tax=Lysinibacillus cavernae TaxID=2666135 RepID=UPI0012D8A019|nr:DUF3888 domain-containing protein [Lysinibacillus cavernae]
MKKFAYILMILVFILMIPNKMYARSEQIDDKLFADLLMTVLNPSIEKEISNYYGYHKQYPLNDPKILSIIREGQFSFIVKVQVVTFEHAHSPPYGKETITFEVLPNEIKTLSFQHEGDDVEKEINAFYRATLSNLEQSFGLNLASYSSYTYNQLQYQAEINNEMTSLVTIADEIVTNILFPERKIPYKNVVDPVTFIKGNSGFMLFKKADGTNVRYQLQKTDGTWKVTDKASKSGKKMDYKLPWYV